LAEVPVVGTIDGKPVSGQIDRLGVLKDEVHIVDFKTNRFVPKEIPDIYKKQLNAYKDLLKGIFPDKIIRAYILWTQNLYFKEVK
jgi:ATP-dependent helicase/nuclease subunit A